MNAMFDSIKLGQAFMARNLSIIPVYRDEQGPPVLTFDQALSQGHATVRETGRVEWADLEVGDTGGQPVFILDGEGLVGARQNRVVNTAVLAQRQSVHRIPVSCVEQGRWAGNAGFSPGSSAFPSLRAVIASGVNASLKAGKGFISDQQAVWKSVSAKLSSLRVSSATSSMHDAYHGVAKSIASYLEEAEFSGASGFMAFVGDEFIGMDILPGPEVFESLKAKLFESYALDAIERANRPAGFVDVSAGERVLDELSGMRFISYSAVSLGSERRAQNDKTVARALTLEKDLISLSAFPLAK